MADIPMEIDMYGMPGFFTDSLIESVRSMVREQIEKPVEEEWRPSNYCVTFSEKTVSYCIGVVDMVGSTKLAATLGIKKMSQYYQYFLNLMSKIIAEFDGQVIKNVGDCLLFYFPETEIWQNKAAITKALECSLAMIEVRGFLCSQMKLVGLPCIDYRISLDYGYVIPMKSTDSKSQDMIGPAVNMCTKINHCAEKNGIAIGGDLYQIAKHLEFSFKEIKGYSAGFKHDYPVYRLVSRDP
jgi:class 3 adenylate cyclase